MRLLDSQPVHRLREHVHQLFSVGDPALGEVDLLRDQDAAICEKGELGPKHLDFAVRGFPPCEHAQARGRLELGGSSAVRLRAQLFVKQFDLQIQLAEAFRDVGAGLCPVFREALLIAEGGAVGGEPGSLSGQRVLGLRHRRIRRQLEQRPAFGSFEVRTQIPLHATDTGTVAFEGDDRGPVVGGVLQ